MSAACMKSQLMQSKANAKSAIAAGDCIVADMSIAFR